MQDNNGDDNSDGSNKGNNRGGDGQNEGGFNWKGFMLLAIAMGLLGLVFFSKSIGDGSDTKTWREFTELVNNKRIHVDLDNPNPELRHTLELEERPSKAEEWVKGWYILDEKDVAANNGEKYKRFQTSVNLARLLPANADFGRIALSPFPPPNALGRSRRNEFWKIQGQNDGDGEKQDHFQRRSRR